MASGSLGSCGGSRWGRRGVALRLVAAALTLVGLLAGGATAGEVSPPPEPAPEPAGAPTPAPAPRSDTLKVDTRTLPRLLKARGFAAPRGFRALVIRIEPDGAGGLRFRPFDWRGTSDDREDWWPASTVKLFAAVAALERTRALGFGPDADVTFHYDEIRHPLPEPPEPPNGRRKEPPPPRAVRTTVEKLVRAALVPSDNQAYDRLIELVGFDRMNRRFLSRRNGLRTTTLLRSYAHRVRDAETGYGTSRHSPPITLSDGKRRKSLRERWGKGRFQCPEQGNCSTLHDLAEAMRRVMLHDELPAKERFDLGEAELALLRDALSSPRERGNGVVDGLREGFGDRPVRFHHKPGYAYRWFSDVVFVEATDTGERWIVAMAAHRNRNVLDDASRLVGAILAEGALRSASSRP